jgi:hypothetical protein
VRNRHSEPWLRGAVHGRQISASGRDHFISRRVLPRSLFAWSGIMG